MANPEFEAAFEALKSIFEPYAKANVVLADEPGKYYIGLPFVRAKDGYRLWLGGVEIKKTYVSAHVVPVYMCAELLEQVSPPLKQRMQGKACFNFKKPDAAAFADFTTLLAACAQRMSAGAEGYVREA